MLENSLFGPLAVIMEGLGRLSRSSAGSNAFRAAIFHSASRLVHPTLKSKRAHHVLCLQSEPIKSPIGVLSRRSAISWQDRPLKENFDATSMKTTGNLQVRSKQCWTLLAEGVGNFVYWSIKVALVGLCVPLSIAPGARRHRQRAAPARSV